MQLDLSTDQRLFKETSRGFLDDTMPLEAVRELVDDPAGFERSWWRRGAELGWTAMLVPEEMGGGSLSGDGIADLVLVAEEMGRSVAPGAVLPANVVAAALVEYGGDTFTDLVASIVAGEAIPTWAVYEPGQEWAPDAVATSATKTNGDLVVTGDKDRVEAATVADRFLVTCRLEGEVVQLLIDATAKGVSVAPMEGIDGVRRFGHVSFTDVRVPVSAIVTEASTTQAAIERQLQIALAIQNAETLGVMDRVFDFTRQWAFDRYSFGRPLASYQALKHRFADMRTWLEACAATAAGAAEAVGSRRDDAAELVSVAKSYIGDRSPALVQDCVQLHGGIGVTWEHDIHLYLRRVVVNRALYGTPGRHRLRLAGRLGL